MQNIKEIPVDDTKDAYQLRAFSPLLKDETTEPTEKFSYTIAELERYKNDPFWKTMRSFIICYSKFGNSNRQMGQNMIWLLILQARFISQMAAVCLVLVIMDFDVSGCYSYRHSQPKLYSKNCTKLVAECCRISSK
ncbi:unnamed protein product [Onchocerca flexuosa]|uniref:Uncharacterized protein n=1 Tax=Onchocerca flexuosa TaxID=387005 RepID=A0A183I867_9BILA|nr:unnamed protein product [Onchocerca flexuosa]